MTDLVKNSSTVLGLLMLPTLAFAQDLNSPQELNGKEINTITTAVPFLVIAPDSRAGGMGEVGAATSPDANSIHWNASKLAFAEKKIGFGVSYSPWLRNLVPDINLAYLSGYKKFSKNEVIGMSLREFSLGSIQFTDINGNPTTTANPNEIAADVCYARKLSSKLSTALTLRYVTSNLTKGISANGLNTKPGRAVAVDVSTYYVNDKIKLGGKKASVAAGANISNIGNRMSYSSSAEKNFIPINMRVGTTITAFLDDYNTFSFSADVNKLLVPTNPTYQVDSDGDYILDADGNKIVDKGKDPNVPVVTGMLQSFYDAPGGAKEEFKELSYCLGIEYWYDKLFAVRGGYFYENPTKGNRQYITMGLGLRYNVFGLDFAYLVPTSKGMVSPLQNTLRFTMLFDFEGVKSAAAKPVD